MFGFRNDIEILGRENRRSRERSEERMGGKGKGAEGDKGRAAGWTPGDLQCSSTNGNDEGGRPYEKRVCGSGGSAETTF